MKVVSIVGARPQFVKCAAVSRELRKVATEVLVHTGQHYDQNMSEIFFQELRIPQPDHCLCAGSGKHGEQTGRMLSGIEQVLSTERPDWVVVYGDTNSTLAGALAAAKLHIPVAHVEAGLRSFNRRMPEAINRIVADHLASLHLCPTAAAIENLAREGIVQNVYEIGDVMYDALVSNLGTARATSSVLRRLGLLPKGYVLTTVHRAENTDRPDVLEKILTALTRLAETGHTIAFPMHPRTRSRLGRISWPGHERLLLIEPVSYLDMLLLEEQAQLIITDSGGVQKEAHWLRVPCVTLREETEWGETVDSGWNVLAGTDPQRILSAAARPRPAAPSEPLAEPTAARQIVNILLRSAGGKEAGAVPGVLAPALCGTHLAGGLASGSNPLCESGTP